MVRAPVALSVLPLCGWRGLGWVWWGQPLLSERTRDGTASAKASRQSRIGSPDGRPVAASTAQAGGVERRFQVLPGTSTTGTSMPRRAQDLAGPVGA